MSEHEHCEGCTLYPGCTKAFYNDGSCPCTNCIIKPMCQDICTPYNSYYNDGLPYIEPEGIIR